METLSNLIAHLHRKASDIPIILDARAAGTRTSNERLAEFAFDELGVHAITVQPHDGLERLMPFLERPQKGVFVACSSAGLNSNFIYEDSQAGYGQLPLYSIVAGWLGHQLWNPSGNAGLLAEVKYAWHIRGLREQAGDALPLLIPEIESFHDHPRLVFGAAQNSLGTGVIVTTNAAIYASRGRDFADAARQFVLDLYATILQPLKEQ